MAGFSLQDLDGFGVSVGPGAFTSLRVGLATVKGLALATGKPIAPFSSLALLAANFPVLDMPVCPLFDARKGEVYAGVYRSGSFPQPLRPDCVMSPTDFIASITGPAVFVGDGAERYRALIEAEMGTLATFAPLWANLPRICTSLPLVIAILTAKAGVCPAALLPTYLRASEAEVSRMKATV